MLDDWRECCEVGKRGGGGRKPKGSLAGVGHGARPDMAGREPVLALQATQVYTTKVYTLINAIKGLDQYFHDQKINLDQ